MAMSFSKPRSLRLGDRVGEVRLPVAISPQHGQVDAAAFELGLERRLELPVLLVDRTDAAECAVVVRDLFESLVRDAAPASDVAQERDDVVLPLRAAEARQQDRVVGDRRLDVLGAVRRRSCRAEHDAVRNRHARTSGISVELDAAAGVERNLLAHVPTSFRAGAGAASDRRGRPVPAPRARGSTRSRRGRTQPPCSREPAGTRHPCGRDSPASLCAPRRAADTSRSFARTGRPSATSRAACRA